MTDAPIPDPLHPLPTPAGPDGSLQGDLRRLRDVPVELQVEIGRTRMTVGQTLDLRPGSIVALNRMAGEPIDLLVNGALIARGEVVVIDEQFGLRITQVLGEDAQPATVEPAAEPLVQTEAVAA